ncbi:MAG TPA: hypothetical protein PLS00_08150 [Niabella sp.]|jgi:hypothetical protein|nr:hypothetical protein [Chitinophagaceae bacterium]HRN47815.1 hypothetical protein [Niabella sp.]HUN02813.1 hypothetical protein [Niabella sp.]
MMILAAICEKSAAENPIVDTSFKRIDSASDNSIIETLEYIQSIKDLEQSEYWPNVKPDLLLQNLKTFTIEPFSFYEGKTTNFCAYSALTYIPLKYNPLGFAQFMVELYRTGKSRMGKDVLQPGKAVREEAGLLKYKGALDINPAGQMWFLTLADHYKGYLNRFNLHFDKGDENTFWASTNFAKFNRMLRRLFNANVIAHGADLSRPHVGDLYDYLQSRLKRGEVFLYVNNKKLYRKTHSKKIFHTPTHYVLLISISRLSNGDIELVYWDYGLKTLQQLSPGFFKNIVFGISTWVPKKVKKS